MALNDTNFDDFGVSDEQTDDCKDCDALPAGWPCAGCYIAGKASITAEGYDDV